MSKCSVVVFLVMSVFLVRSAFGCSCSNNTPIQATSEKYRDKAVFTAHVVQLMGRIGNFDGKRMSGQVLAIVRDKYWGLPWYWPKVVVLDGGFLCNIVMAEGEDYLVAGYRSRYGVLQVGSCSRTQPLETAKIDRRTLDGSHCAGPGGTLIGDIRQGGNRWEAGTLSRNTTLTFRKQNGEAFTARSDGDGIYELQHLAPGRYTIDSRYSQTLYAGDGSTNVSEGMCHEASFWLRDYDFSGRLLPGLSGVDVKLVTSGVKSEDVASAPVEPDGRFYFSGVTDGQYLLALTNSLGGSADNFYYPATYDRRKAARLNVVNHKLVGRGELDFDPKEMPFAPVLVELDPASNSGKFSWRVQLLHSNYVFSEASWTIGEKIVRLYGLRGGSYSVQLFGYSTRPMEYGDCASDPVTVQPGQDVAHITVPMSCR